MTEPTLPDLVEAVRDTAGALRHLANTHQYQALGIQGAVNYADKDTVAFREHLATLAETVAAALERLAR